MARRYPIKWTKNQNQRLRYEVANFNKRLDRLLENEPELAEYLPERAYVSNLKENIHTARDLYKEIGKLKRFRADTATKLVTNNEGVVTTQYDLKEVELAVRRINREKQVRLNEINAIEATSRGQPLGLTRGQMGTTEANHYRPTKFDFQKMDLESYEHFKGTISKMDNTMYFKNKDELLRENYLKGLVEVFGNTSEVRELMADINALTIDEFKQKFYGDQEATIDFIYDPLAVEYKFNVIKNIFQDEELDDRTSAQRERYRKVYNTYDSGTGKDGLKNFVSSIRETDGFNKMSKEEQKAYLKQRIEADRQHFQRKHK